MYLYGSLARGDFDPGTSDIDFLIVTTDELAPDLISTLEAMHARIWARGMKWAKKLEGAYVPQRAVRRHDANAALCPTINEGKFYLARQASDWIIQRHIIREHGIVLAGPAPETLIDPVSANDLRRAVTGILHEWWQPNLNDPKFLRRPGYQPYAVLTMCRALYTLQCGAIVSKPVAARWAQERHGPRWAKLIERALDRRENPSEGDIEKTVEFIRYTLDFIPNVY